MNTLWLGLILIVYIHKQCRTNGGIEAENEITVAMSDLQNCLKNQINFTAIDDEFEAAKKNGSMREIYSIEYKAYCPKAPQLGKCFGKFANKLRRCVQEEDQSSFNSTLDVLGRLGEMVCSNNGDLLATYISKGGVECWQSQKERILTCVNSAFFNKAYNFSSSSLFFLDAEKCRSIESFSPCIVAALENCENSTPANIIDAVLEFIYRNACRNRFKHSTIHSLSNGIESATNNLVRSRRDTYGNGNSYRELQLTAQSGHEFTDKVNKKLENCKKDITEKNGNYLPEPKKYSGRLVLDIVHSILKYGYENGKKTSEGTHAI